MESNLSIFLFMGHAFGVKSKIFLFSPRSKDFFPFIFFFLKVLCFMLTRDSELIFEV